MRNISQPLTTCFCALLLLSSASWVQAQSERVIDNQPTTKESEVQSVLRELRALRIIVQNGQSWLSKALITVERIRIQRDLVDRLDRQLEEKKNEIRELRKSQEDDTSRLKQETDRAPQLPDEARDKSKELIAELQRELEWKEQDERGLRQREEQLVLRLQLEQSKLDELQRRLDLIETELDGSLQIAPKTRRP